MNLKLQSLIRKRDRAETRMSRAENDGNRYNHPTIHEWERDIAQELIEEEREKQNTKEASQ